MDPAKQEQLDPGPLWLLGQAIRRERERQDVSQERFAWLFGLDRSYVGRVERGEVNLTFRKLMVFIRALRAEPVTFFRDLHVDPHARRQVPQRKPLPRAVNDLSTMVGLAVMKERQWAGLTQEELADKAGVARSYISWLECGRRNPTFAQLMRILESLGVEPAEFFQHFPLPPKKRTSK
ncbi:Predicted transcriptional regulator with C-terminal CBS domains [Variovorax sp. HW608]|uniref:helix-turn-helix domain-containing protein n=1 Tax=Variovorax sp. HW608 TaxID=1034889 RepID=UPI00081F782A|nr:helix-turn-helix transcriptional regulator [Variovorax sp. HW608]SCK54325.1 Predicted transcriptional regulator with C-terminal CBS domains [Variovorax sp. HW608]